MKKTIINFLSNQTYKRLNKKGESGESEEEGAAFLEDPIVHFVILIVFMIGMFAFFWQFQSGGAIWEEYYVKEVVKLINLAEPGDEICIDVHRATVIGFDNEVSVSEFFIVDNIGDEFCVKLSKGRKTCYNYFNDVDIILDKDSLELGINKNDDGEIVNVLCIDIKEGRKESAG